MKIWNGTTFETILSSLGRQLTANATVTGFAGGLQWPRISPAMVLPILPLATATLGQERQHHCAAELGNPLHFRPADSNHGYAIDYDAHRSRRFQRRRQDGSIAPLVRLRGWHDWHARLYISTGADFQVRQPRRLHWYSASTLQHLRLAGHRRQWRRHDRYVAAITRQCEPHVRDLYSAFIRQTVRNQRSQNPDRWRLRWHSVVGLLRKDAASWANASRRYIPPLIQVININGDGRADLLMYGKDVNGEHGYGIVSLEGRQLRTRQRHKALFDQRSLQALHPRLGDGLHRRWAHRFL